ncbi:hypothetical protein BH11PSE2_BH11PSE2_19900 [soil metagenome]
MKRTIGLIALAMIGLTAGGAQSQPPVARPTSGMPVSVNAAIGSLVAECTRAGGKAQPAANVSIGADLNGDGLTDWVINEGAFKCPGSAQLFGGASGASIMVFAGEPGGDAKQSFSGYGFGVALNGPAAKRVLWIKTTGVACGQRSATRKEDEISCDRPVQWNAAAKRFEMAPIFKARIPSQIFN